MNKIINLIEQILKTQNRDYLNEMARGLAAQHEDK